MIAAATILISMSRSHVEATDSPTCTCGGLPCIGQIINEAEEYPQTDTEDWKSIGVEFLRLRAGGNRCSPLGTPTEAGSDDEEKNRNVLPKRVVGKKALKNTLKPAMKQRTKQPTKEKKGKEESKQKVVVAPENEAGIRRSTRVRFVKTEMIMKK